MSSTMQTCSVHLARALGCALLLSACSRADNSIVSASDAARVHARYAHLDGATRDAAETRRLADLAKAHQKPGLALAYLRELRDDARGSQRLNLAREIQELEPRAALVELRPSDAASSFALSVDGASMANVRGGVWLDLDPGHHDILISRTKTDGSLMWACREVDVRAGEMAAVPLDTFLSEPFHQDVHCPGSTHARERPALSDTARNP